MREINERDLSAAAGRDRRGAGDRGGNGEQKGHRDACRAAERPAAPPRGILCAVLRGCRHGSWKGGAVMAQEVKTTAEAARNPEAAASLRREGTTRVEQKTVVREVPLQDVATLETELSALQRRQQRLAPEMDRCGEPLY